MGRSKLCSTNQHPYTVTSPTNSIEGHNTLSWRLHHTDTPAEQVHKYSSSSSVTRVTAVCAARQSPFGPPRDREGHPSVPGPDPVAGVHDGTSPTGSKSYGRPGRSGLGAWGSGLTIPPQCKAKR